MSKHLTSSRSIFIFVCALVAVIGGLFAAAIYNSRFTVIEPMAKMELPHESPAAPPEPRVPTIAAERKTYASGETAVIKGTNWAPGERVTIVTKRGEEPSGRRLRVVADETGSFTATHPMTAEGAKDRDEREREKSDRRGEDNVIVASATGASSRSTAEAEYYAVEPEKDVEELLQQEAFWFNRVSYPTGRFDPEWVRRAAIEEPGHSAFSPCRQKAEDDGDADVSVCSRPG